MPTLSILYGYAVRWSHTHGTDHISRCDIWHSFVESDVTIDGFRPRDPKHCCEYFSRGFHQKPSHNPTRVWCGVL